MAVYKHLKALFIFFSFSFFLLLVHSQDTTSFTFDTFPANPTDLFYGGGTHVPSGLNFLRLLGDYSSLPYWGYGRVAYSRPVQFWQRSTSRQATFETTIRFVVSTNTESGSPADGLAFFIQPLDAYVGYASGNLGLFELSGTSDSLFAVEFDTYSNEWDPSYRHIGIDIVSRESRVTARFDSATGEDVTARINYDANTRNITVAASSASQSATLSYVLDLKTVLPEQVRVGISSAVGSDRRLGGVFDINSWYFTSTLVSDLTGNGETYIRQPV